MWLHYHPDGMIFIRDEHDIPVYVADLKDFERDYGSPFPALPEGMAQLELFEGRVFMYDAKNNERDAGHIDPTPYRAVLEAVGMLIEKQAERTVKPKGIGDIAVPADQKMKTVVVKP